MNLVVFRWLPLVVLVLTVTAGTTPSHGEARNHRLDAKLEDARLVYRELLETPDRGVPEALLAKCRCVAVIPGVIKGALGYGARFGQGVVSCRSGEGWSAPAFVRIAGGSVGFQIGAQKSDVVLFIMTERGARSLLESKFTLGGTASIAAGPLGRTGEAATDLKLSAEIYSYAKAKGLFAGVSLEGARLAPDEKAIREYYGANATARGLLFDQQPDRVPPDADAFRHALP